MSERGKLRDLLLVSGLLSIVFLLSALKVESNTGIGLLESSLTTGFAVSLIAFLLTGSVMLGKRLVRNTQKITGQTWGKCIICDEPLPQATLRQMGRLHSFHYKTIHPEYWNWDQRWRRKFALATIALTIVLGSSGTYVVVTENFWIGAAILAVPIPPWFTIMGLIRLKTQRFRSRWMAQAKPI